MNLFQEESPYEQSFYYVFCCASHERIPGTPFEWKAGDSYVQLINIDKKTS